MGAVFAGGPIKTGLNVLKDPLGQNAIQNGMNAQAGQTDAANAVIQKTYDQQRSDLSPWVSAGTGALSEMQDPYFQKNFSMSDFQADPSYQFRMQQGMNALQGSAAARGGLMSGNTLQGITDYSQNAASQEYQNAYNRFSNNQQNRFSRLSNIAGMGQNATGQMVNAGGNYANQMSNNLTGLGNAYAAGNMALANSNQKLISSGLSAAAMMG